MSEMSLPSWERGLKLFRSNGIDRKPDVAPFVGAWIETVNAVTPAQTISSLPSWERGLKPESVLCLSGNDLSLPSWERGLKHRQRCGCYPDQRRSLRGSVD